MSTAEAEQNANSDSSRGELCMEFCLTVLFCYTEKNSFLCDSNIHTINCQFLWLKGEKTVKSEGYYILRGLTR